jgi:hypothetical protein
LNPSSGRSNLPSDELNPSSGRSNLPSGRLNPQSGTEKGARRQEPGGGESDDRAVLVPRQAGDCGGCRPPEKARLLQTPHQALSPFQKR